MAAIVVLQQLTLYQARAGVNLPMEAEWHQPVPKSWAAVCLLHAVFFKYFYRKEKDLPTRQTCEKHAFK